MQIAVITGASSGLGKEFVLQINRKYHPDGIWAIARREDRLVALQNLCPNVRIFPLDLQDGKTFTHLQETLKKTQPEIRWLVNAAGFAKIGSFADLSWEDEQAMIEVNCKAPVQLIQLALPYMQKKARIINICSAAAFQPLPYLNIYAATKSFLLRYSRALRWELFPKGIGVTAVCPDWVKTEFLQISHASPGGNAVRHHLFPASPSRVVAQALIASNLNLPVSAYGFASIHRLCAKFIPHEIIIAFWELFRRI